MSDAQHHQDVAHVREQVAQVRARIADAAMRAGRDASEVALVAVTKTVPVALAAAALDAGVRELGENRAQDLVAKATALASRSPAPRWHFIGRLQRNKVRSLAPHVALWESIDRAELVTELEHRAPGARVLVQVNLAGEAQKGGCAPEEVPALVESATAAGLDVVGLMTVPPLADDPRPHFARVRALAASLGLRELSMGMSGDYEVAVEEGATIVRVGTALFGPRRAPNGLRR
ncbi:MAG TPA: YggS family pyridoxal phosphate-dependent enzyme [Acidimicrobiia bacterium]|nr:YggS family pyridoxal phosphate-dependent enzyme [Acidimicrobiia bacterium]